VITPAEVLAFAAAQAGSHEAGMVERVNRLALTKGLADVISEAAIEHTQHWREALAASNPARAFHRGAGDLKGANVIKHLADAVDGIAFELAMQELSVLPQPCIPEGTRAAADRWAKVAAFVQMNATAAIAGGEDGPDLAEVFRGETAKWLKLLLASAEQSLKRSVTHCNDHLGSGDNLELLVEIEKTIRPVFESVTDGPQVLAPLFGASDPVFIRAAVLRAALLVRSIPTMPGVFAALREQKCAELAAAIDNLRNWLALESRICLL
jgi:hypothetical protein